MIVWARQAGVLLLALTMGCATAPSRWNVAPSWLNGSRSTEKETGKLRKSAEQEPEDREPLIAQTESEEVKVQHDPATRMLIEAELRDASPEDRQEWLALLAAVDSSQVPYVLQKRRFKNGDKPSDVVAAAATTESSATKHEIAPASHSQSEDSAPPAEMPAVMASTPVAEYEPAPTSKAPQADANSAGWPQRIRSLADPTRIWSHTEQGGTDHPSPEKAEKTAPERQERSTFGLPLVIGTQAKADAAIAEFHAREASVAQPVNPAPVEMSVKAPRLTPGSQLWEDEIQKLISLLEAEVSVQSGGTGDRDHVRKQVALRMLYLIEDQPQKAQLTIPGIPSNEQEFWTELFMGLSEHLDRSGTVDPGERATQTMALLKSAAFRLQDQARLRIPNLSFCQTINGFGNYEGYLTDQFSPGQTVLVYAEIRNFTSQPSAEGEYRTRIRSTIEIYTGGESQQLVDRSTFDATEDHCRSLRTDYYHSYRIALPAHLSRGTHLLKLIIQDELSGKIATETLTFTIQ